MKYRYEAEVKPADLWQLSMYRTYHSVAGVVNIVFTVGLLILTAKFWGTTGVFLRTLLILGCILFPVLQPIGVYLNSMAQTERFPKGVALEFDDHGIHVTSGEQKETIPWAKIYHVSKEINMVVIFSGKSHGYMLTDRVLGAEKQEFLAYLEACLKKAKKK